MKPGLHVMFSLTRRKAALPLLATSCALAGMAGALFAPAASAAPPPAPTNLVAHVDGPILIRLTWSGAFANDTGFCVERADDAGFTMNVVSVRAGIGMGGYVDATVAPGGTYYYHVFAFNSSGESPFSNVVVATTPLLTAEPSPPTFLTATVLNLNQVNLMWVDNSDNEAGFRIDRASDSRFSTNVISIMVAVDDTSYGDTSVAAGARYYYRVSALGASGCSSPSNTATVTVSLTRASASTPVPTPTMTPTSTPAPTWRPVVSPTPLPSPMPTMTPTSTPVPTPRPVASPTPLPSPMPTMTPTSTPAPTARPVASPTPLPSPTPTPQPADAPLSLVSPTSTVSVGETFQVTIETEAAADQQVSGVDAFIDFDPQVLQVVDSIDAEPGVQIAPGGVLDEVLQNNVDNVSGHIAYSAGKLEGVPPSGQFVVATITLQAMAATGQGVTQARLSFTYPRVSMVAYGSGLVPGQHSDFSVAVTP